MLRPDTHRRWLLRAGAALAAAFVLLGRPALAQRVAFPSPVAEGATTTVAAPGVPPVAAPIAGPQAPLQPAPMMPAYAQQFGVVPQTAPQWGAAPAAPLTPPPAGYATPGAIGAPAPQWEVYGDPALQPPSLLPQQPYLNQPQGVWPYNRVRFLNELRIQNTYIYGNGGSDVEMNDIDLTATFAIPLSATQPPLLITPGFSFHFWDGPDSGATNGADLPPRVYDAFLDAAWKPQFSPTLGADLGVRVGVFSDFTYYDNKSLRILGRALAVMTINQAWQLTGGIVYLDRNEIKLLPAGGLIWTPDPDTRYEIVFPYPKLAERLTTIGNTDLWVYVAADYGGGSWTITREDGTEDSVDYNDIRVRLGLEWLRFQGARGWFEVGYVFDREIVYEVQQNNFDPGSTFMLRAGLAY